MKIPWRVAVGVSLLPALLTSCSTNPTPKNILPDPLPRIAAPVVDKSDNPLRPPMQALRPSPGDPTDVLDTPGSFGDEDWLKHSVDGGDNGPPPFTAFATARNDWFGLLGRPAFGTGK